MTYPFVDTDVIIRLLTGDDVKKQKDATMLFGKVESGKLVLQAPDTVIADAVYVLSSPRLYRINRTSVQALLTPLVRLAGFKVKHRQILLGALQIYARTKLDFSDALIIASMQKAKSHILYSYDEGFDNIASITRKTPSNH